MKPDRGNAAAYIVTLPDNVALLYRAQYAMRWRDMDAFGHLNNAVYFTYFEQARVDWLRSINSSHALVLANISCTFLKPLKYPASLDVRLYAGAPGRSSLDTFYALYDSATEELCALAHGTIVWYDHAAGKSIKIPDEVRRHLV
ncbi:MAG: acyl-CoA thioesterase [Thiogranum sp.]